MTEIPPDPRPKVPLLNRGPAQGGGGNYSGAPYNVRPEGDDGSADGNSDNQPRDLGGKVKK